LYTKTVRIYKGNGIFYEQIFTTASSSGRLSIRALPTPSAASRSIASITGVSAFLAAKSLSRLSQADSAAKVEALLVKYRAAIGRAAAKLSKSTSASAQEKFLQSMLVHQAYLGQVENAGNVDTKKSLELTRDQNWEKLNSALQSLTPEQLAAKIQGLQVSDPSLVLRRAALLREWQNKLSPEQRDKLEAVVQGLAEKLRSISPTQAAALAERIRTLSATAFQFRMSISIIADPDTFAAVEHSTRI
jgi:hypothetical protein